MKRTIMALLVIMALGTPAFAQATKFDNLTPYLPTATERKVADWVSLGTVGAALALDAKAAWDDRNNRTHDLELFAVRAGVTYGWAAIAKGLTHRERPDGSNDQSFYSMHTAYAFSAMGGPSIRFSLPLAVSSGGLRIAAGKHYLTDVLVGAGVGALTSRIR
jgi:membrane-associated phospholipid phosphatase